MFVKGKSGNPGGLKKGYRHLSTQIKENFLTAFDKSGGLPRLVEWIEKSDKHRGEFYKMVIQVMPKDVDLGGQGESGAFVIKIERSEKGADGSYLPLARFTTPSLQ